MFKVGDKVKTKNHPGLLDGTLVLVISNGNSDFQFPYIIRPTKDTRMYVASKDQLTELTPLDKLL